MFSIIVLSYFYPELLSHDATRLLLVVTKSDVLQQISRDLRLSQACREIRNHPAESTKSSRVYTHIYSYVNVKRASLRVIKVICYTQ
uniref:Uncharacterized protein n=1 Tax=Pararge aegeria TaxID=116150 RepID=S4P7Y2_9NEOP